MKREVQIIGLSYSQSQPNAYVVVLSEVNGHRKLPIVIKAQDAHGVDDLDIETTVGDALALALTFESTLYVDEEVLAKCGIQTDETGVVVEKKSKKKEKKSPVVSIDDLKRMMEEAIKNEEYEVAAELRDKITKLEEEK